MSRKGRISHDRVEVLEKEVAELKERLAAVETHPALSVPAIQPAKTNGYVPQFDRWPGNER